MKIAFSKPTRNDERQRELVAAFRACGYDGLQLKGNQYSAYLDDPPRIFADYPELEGAISGLIASLSLDDAGEGRLRKVIRFAQPAAADLVIVVLGSGREGLNRDGLASIAARVAELAREAEDIGVKLSLHNHADNPLMHVEDLSVFFEQAGDVPSGLTVDTAHLVKSGISDIAGVIRRFADSIDNFHVKDIRDGEFAVLGEGSIDFGPVFAAIRDIGYDGWVSADEESGSEMGEALTKCYRVLTRGLGL